MKSEEVYKEYFEDEEHDLSESPYETYSYQAGWNFGLRRASVIIADKIRPNGKWIKPSNRSIKSYQRICNRCHNIAYFCGKGNYPNCPYCLAEMED